MASSSSGATTASYFWTEPENEDKFSAAVGAKFGIDLNTHPRFDKKGAAKVLRSWLYNCATKPSFNPKDCESFFWPTRWQETSIDPEKATLNQLSEIWQAFCVHYATTEKPSSELWKKGYPYMLRISPMESFIVDAGHNSMVSDAFKDSAIEFVYQMLLFMSWLACRDNTSTSEDAEQKYYESKWKTKVQGAAVLETLRESLGNLQLPISTWLQAFTRLGQWLYFAQWTNSPKKPGLEKLRSSSLKNLAGSRYASRRNAWRTVATGNFRGLLTGTVARNYKVRALTTNTFYDVQRSGGGPRAISDGGPMNNSDLAVYAYMLTKPGHLQEFCKKEHIFNLMPVLIGSRTMVTEEKEVDTEPEISDQPDTDGLKGTTSTDTLTRQNKTTIVRGSSLFRPISSASRRGRGSGPGRGHRRMRV
jgi:hypothetical protein